MQALAEGRASGAAAYRARCGVAFLQSRRRCWRHGCLRAAAAVPDGHRLGDAAPATKSPRGWPRRRCRGGGRPSGWPRRLPALAPQRRRWWRAALACAPGCCSRQWPAMACARRQPRRRRLGPGPGRGRRAAGPQQRGSLWCRRRQRKVHRSPVRQKLREPGSANRRHQQQLRLRRLRRLGSLHCIEGCRVATRLQARRGGRPGAFRRAQTLPSGQRAPSPPNPEA